MVSEQVRHKSGCTVTEAGLEACNFGFKKKRKCTIHVAKTKVLISFAVTAKLICVFVFAYADCWFSGKVAQLSVCLVIYHLMKLSQDEKVLIIVMFYRFRT